MIVAPTAQVGASGATMPDTDPIWMRPAPRRVLLASDLSARCDRALDRAALIAAHWQGPLTVLNVADAPQAHIDLNGRKTTGKVVLLP